MKYHPFYAYIGQNIQQSRLAANMTLEALAEAARLTLRDAQDYETGTRRHSPALLVKLSAILGVSVSALILGSSESKPISNDISCNEYFYFEDKLLNLKETLYLLETYYAIPNASIRNELLEFMRLLSSNKVTVTGATLEENNLAPFFLQTE